MTCGRIAPNLSHKRGTMILVRNIAQSATSLTVMIMASDAQHWFQTTRAQEVATEVRQDRMQVACM